MTAPATKQEPIEVHVKLSLTPDQWNGWLRHYAGREMSCEMGLDVPKLADLVAFQIVRQMREQGLTHRTQTAALK